MHLSFRNVNDAWYGLVEGIYTGSIPTTKTDSRNGPVMQVMEPVIVTYQKPRERVLFNKSRDANPFFHLYEALWMLAGRNDVEPLAYYASNIKNYSDDGETLNGAYGYRWRRAVTANVGSKFHEQLDQLDILIDHFKRLPDSRRAVLQMWNVEDDLLRIGSDLDFMQGKQSKDVCCNTHVYFSIRTEESSSIRVGERLIDVVKVDKYLDMTVCNRSNDMIWGLLGANAVHFSFLQEYMANCLGVDVGVYNQITNNMHVYENNWKPEEWLEEREHALCYPDLCRLKLVEHKEDFDKQCNCLVNEYYSSVEKSSRSTYYSNPWLHQVARPMCLAFHHHKRREYDDALWWMETVEAPDWKRAGTEWIERRKAKWIDRNPYLENAKRRGDV